MKFILTFCYVLLVSVVSGQTIQYVNPAGLAVSKGYTQVVMTQGGRTVYISGQVSANAQGQVLHPGDFRKQVEQVYENLKAALAAVGATFADVVKTTTFVVNSDAQKIAIVREVRSRYYTAPYPPASTYLGVQALYDPNVLVEIEAVAVLPR